MSTTVSLFTVRAPVHVSVAAPRAPVRPPPPPPPPPDLSAAVAHPDGTTRATSSTPF